jgi:hypothetical protein
VHNILEKLGVNRRCDVVGYIDSSPAVLGIQPIALAPKPTAIGSSSV